MDVNIAAKFGGANCLSGHSEFIARTRLDKILAEITPTITPPAYVKPAFHVSRLVSEIRP